MDELAKSCKNRGKIVPSSGTLVSRSLSFDGVAEESKGRKDGATRPTGPSDFFELTSPTMAEMVACLQQGKVVVLGANQAARHLASPHLEQLTAASGSDSKARIVSITRGRISTELFYAVSSRRGSDVFAQVAGSLREEQLFHGAETRLSDLDYSPADEALACAVVAEQGTSAIGVLSDDGKGMRTVTEGDVIDRAPRWLPGGRSELVYASAGIGRTKAGKAIGRAPFALHRLRFSDNSVEVLMSDARYDYIAAVPVSESLLYALRQSYDSAPARSALGRLSSVFRGLFASEANAESGVTGGSRDLLRITPQGSHLVLQDVLAFDVSSNGSIVFSNGRGVFRILTPEATPEEIAPLRQVEQLVIYW